MQGWQAQLPDFHYIVFLQDLVNQAEYPSHFL